MPFGQLTARQRKLINAPFRRRRLPVQRQINQLKQRIKKEPLIAVQSPLDGTLNDTAVISHVVVSTGTITNGVTMDGMTATLKSLRIKGWMKSVGANNAPGRIDVILDRRPVGGTIATYDEIYAPHIAGGATVNAFISPDTKTRFKLLASFINAPVTNDGQVFFFERYIRMNHKIITTVDGQYTQAGQNKNAILIARWTDAAANEPTYQIMTQSVVLEDN